MLDGVKTEHPAGGDRPRPGGRAPTPARAPSGVCIADRRLSGPPPASATGAAFRQASRAPDYPRSHGSEARRTRSRPARLRRCSADLPTRGADWVDTLVELLRDKTVRPLTLVTRAIVFGIIVFAASRGHRGPAVDHPDPPAHRLRLRRPGLALGPGGRGRLRRRRHRGLEPADRSDAPAEEAADDRVPPGGDRRIGPGRADRGHLRRPGPARPPGHRRRALLDQRPARRPAHAHHRGRELPRVRRRDHGARAHAGLPRAGGPVRRRVPHGQGVPGRPVAPAVRPVGRRSRRRGAHLRGRRADHRHRRPVADARPPQRGAAPRLRGVHLRHLRRLLLP